jgi:acetoacetyl-CoA synthetase
LSPEPLWTPPPERTAGSNLRAFLDHVGRPDYGSAWSWSVDPATIGEFWSSIADWFDVKWSAAPSVPVEEDRGAVPGVRWFPEGRLNYAERAGRRRSVGGGGPASVDQPGALDHFAALAQRRRRG